MSTKIKCAGKTLKGNACSRFAVNGSKYCKTHSHSSVSNHPPFKEMIGKAIVAEANYSGSTRVYIKKYLECNYKILPTNPHINKSIKSMVDSGELVVNSKHTGHFRVSPRFRKSL